MKFRPRFWLQAVILVLAMVAGSSASSWAQPLTANQREDLRYHLELIYNDVDLSMRNQKTDLSDMKRIQRDADELKVFERVPMQEDLPGLKKNLAESGQAVGVTLKNVRVIGRSKPKRPIPAFVYNDSQFRLDPSQVVQEIDFEATVQGTEDAAKKWISSWQTEQMRLVEPQGGYGKLPIRQAGKEGEWLVRAHAFRFRPIQFPKLRARDPMTLLPAWAKKDPELFSRQEPVLWGFVTRTKQLLPEAGPIFRQREDYYLLRSRVDWFFRKATPRKPSAGPSGQ